jgi:hypothetical protein
MRDFFRKLFERAPSAGERAAATEVAPGARVALPVETVSVPGKSAVAERERLAQRPGVTPIIMGAPEDVELIAELLEAPGEAPSQTLEKAAALDVETWLRERQASVFGGEPLPTGPWPGGQAEPGGLSVHLDVLSKKPKPEVLIGLFPTPDAWKAPAFVRYGGWNECPEAHVHVALHRRWHELHGARIACLSGDIVECLVDRPPATREAALALAREQYLYCPDIVDQGVETVENLAATLLGGKVWYFWWD